MRTLTLLLAVLSLALFAVVGCGDEDQAASGAAELVPAGALFYGEATLNPESDQKEAIEAILRKFPGDGDAGAKLEALIEEGLRKSDAPVTFKDDIEPWLGDTAGFFAGGLTRAGEFKSAALLVASEDDDKAEDALEKSAEGRLERKSHRDVEYLTDESGEAAAVLDGFVVLGSEAGVKAVINTTQDGSPLSDDERYNDTLDEAADDRLGLFYMNSPELPRALREQGMPLPDSFRRFLEEPFVATLDAHEDGVTLEGMVPEDLGRASFFGAGSGLLSDLPADSWLALAQTDLGALLDFYVDAFAGLAGGRDAVERQFRAATGLDLDEDVLSWMGDFGVFVRGTSVPALDGALVVETSDETASRRFLDALERLARGQAEGGLDIGPLSAPGGGDGFSTSGGGLPKPVHVFQRAGRVVLAYGDAAAADAIDAPDKLGDSPDFSAVRDSLGDYDVSLYVLMQPIFDLVDSTGAGSDADWRRAKPYLEPLRALVGGSSGGGGELRSALKLVMD